LEQTGEYEIIITEIGGTVGDIESLPYIEAVRQMKWEMGSTNCLVIHLTLIPYLKSAKELKTKPTQHSVKELLENGVQPDILVCRTEYPLSVELRRKIALFCNVTTNAVVESIDAESIYDVPLLMLKENLDKTVLGKLKMRTGQEPDMDKWKEFLGKLKNPTSEVTIALVGKYIELNDAYKSILESFIHSGAVNECRVNVQTVHSEHIHAGNVYSLLSDKHGILVAPGFGSRGIEGKIEAIRFARENNIPFFGICLGMQCAVIEFARNVAGLSEANSTEMSGNTSAPVIDMMEEQKKVVNKGGTMRLGAYECQVKKNSKAFQAYQASSVQERHRHRYELNNQYVSLLEEYGMLSTGVNPETGLVEIIELKKHPWFVGVQFHPELRSTVDAPHPLFNRFVLAALEEKKRRAGGQQVPLRDEAQVVS
jgi:CTP synthase